MIYCSIEIDELLITVTFSDSFWINPNLNFQKKIQDITGAFAFACPDSALRKAIKRNIDGLVQEYLNKKQISFTEKKYWTHYKMGE